MKIKPIITLFLLMISLSLHGESAKIGLALSGGGARGFAHIGVLKVFDEIGLKIDYLAGTSMGAVIGGLYAIGYSAEEIENIVLHEIEWDNVFFDTIRRSDYYVGNKRWNNYYNFSFLLSDSFSPQLPQGFVSGNRFLNIFFRYTYHYSHISDFNDLPVPFSCIATDLLTGETVVINYGSLHEAMRASMSVPSIFEPFFFRERYLIDGGIKMNLPAPVVQEMGSDYVIGVKVTSGLRPKERLTNPVLVFDQSLNISSTDRTIQHLDYCSLVIEPDLEGLTATDFNRIPEIIRAGENAARAQLPELLRIAEQQKTTQQRESALNEGTGKKRHREAHLLATLPDSLMIDRIIVEGNEHISSSKVREFSNLKTDTPLTKMDIIDGTTRAYNSNLFNQIYPVIRQTDDGYDLIIKVTEKTRGSIGINFRYNDRDDLILSSIGELHNYLGSNSSLFVGLSIGGIREILFDYVKNFGREWGVYFRVFPYLNEHTLYFYNEEQEKTASSKSLEYGSLLGLGAFGLDRFIIESYLFSYYKFLYRDIADHEESKFFSTGIGLKFYTESLDDVVFPMSGNQLLIKYSFADDNFFSDASYKKIYGRLQSLLPLFRNSSLRMQFEYGSFFDDQAVVFDPFYIGGFDSFLGMQPYEKSAPIIKVFTVSNRFEPFRNIFFDLQFNIANTGQYDLWSIDDSTLIGGGIKAGYRSIIGPLRGGLGINRRGKVHSYISLGFDFDPFEFSRR